ncbi:acyl carrier protein [Streptomyces rubiginosohelvolus]|uniref:acyl carrier protein n=1 Tax=Streptomyces rubiginosohelvolus TaxID=67362 RepID=UPI0035DD44E5
MSTNLMTLDDLKQILLAAAGVDDGIELNDDFGDAEFNALGYDSLALMEISNRIEREYGIELGDDTLSVAPTPLTFVAHVNDLLGARATA